jgi:hypothetical protein
MWPDCLILKRPEFRALHKQNDPQTSHKARFLGHGAGEGTLTPGLFLGKEAL